LAFALLGFRAGFAGVRPGDFRAGATRLRGEALPRDGVARVAELRLFGSLGARRRFLTVARFLTLAVFFFRL